MVGKFRVGSNKVTPKCLRSGNPVAVGMEAILVTVCVNIQNHKALVLGIHGVGAEMGKSKGCACCCLIKC